MARRATSRRPRNRNLFGLSLSRKRPAPVKCARRSPYSIGEATKAAYAAGVRTPDTGHFSDWLCAAGLDQRGAQLIRRLRAAYEEGFESKMAPPDTERTRRTAVPPASERRPGKTVRYKGVDILPVGDGDYTISSDTRSVFESVADAKAVIDHMARNPRATQRPTEHVIGTFYIQEVGGYWFPVQKRHGVFARLDRMGRDDGNKNTAVAVAQAYGRGEYSARNPRPITLTRQLAWAAATDAGNRSMRKAGRRAWNEQDFNAAVREFDRLWPEPHRNPHEGGYGADLGTKLVDELAGDAQDAATAVMESEVPVFEGPEGGFPGIHQITSYDNIQAALGYCHGVKGLYPDVCVVHHGAVWCVVLDANQVRAAEAVEVADRMDLAADTAEVTASNPRPKRGKGGHPVFGPFAPGTPVTVNDSQRLHAAATVLDWNGDTADAWGEHHAARLRMTRLGNEILAPHYTITPVMAAAQNPAAKYLRVSKQLSTTPPGADGQLRGPFQLAMSGTAVQIQERGRGGHRFMVQADYYGTPLWGWVDAENLMNAKEWQERERRNPRVGPDTVHVRKGVHVFRGGVWLGDIERVQNWGRDWLARPKVGQNEFFGSKAEAVEYVAKQVPGPQRNPGDFDAEYVARMRQRLDTLNELNRDASLREYSQREGEVKHIRALLKFYNANGRLPSMADSALSPVGRNPHLSGAGTYRAEVLGASIGGGYYGDIRLPGGGYHRSHDFSSPDQAKGWVDAYYVSEWTGTTDPYAQSHSQRGPRLVWKADKNKWGRYTTTWKIPAKVAKAAGRRNPSYTGAGPGGLAGEPKGYPWELVFVEWPRDNSRVPTTHNFEVANYEAGIKLAKRISGDSQQYSHITNKAFDFGIYNRGRLSGGAEWDFRGNSQNIKFRKQKRVANTSRKRNSLFSPSAEDLYEDFHGRPPEGEVVIETPVVDPGKLAELGTMVSIKVDTLSGYAVEIGFETDPPMLCSNKAGNQLYFEGGNQKLDLKAIHMSGAEWVRDLMTIGNLTETTYRTQKEFDKFKTIDYYHANGEDTGVPPQLIYDQLSGLLTVSGGQYKVTPDGIEN